MHPRDEPSYARRRNQANNNAAVHSSIGQVWKWEILNCK